MGYEARAVPGGREKQTVSETVGSREVEGVNEGGSESEVADVETRVGTFPPVTPGDGVGGGWSWTRSVHTLSKNRLFVFGF